MRYILSRSAAADYLAVYHTGLELFGVRQVESYMDRLDRVLDLIADNPQMGRQRPELSGAPRSHIVGSHVILWDASADGAVTILRIRHQHEDWLGGSPSG